MRYARRVDANLSEIVRAARACGFRVHVRNDDLADLDVQDGAGRHEIWELKARAVRYTKLQQQRRAEGWKIILIRSVEDVLARRAQVPRTR